MSVLQSSYIQANGIRFHVVTAGCGPLLMFLHGFPAHWFMWHDQLLEFSKQYHVAAPDTRGVNLSAKAAHLDGYQFAQLVEDVRALADALIGAGRKFSLVAHDWGGVVAWGFAMKHPELLEKLVIINAPHPVIFERELRHNPAQRQASNYTFAFNNFDGYRWDEKMADDGFVGLSQHLLRSAVTAGRYTADDLQQWIEAWKTPGSLNAGLNYYRANNVNPPFNDQHPASTVATCYSAQRVLAGIANTLITVPTLVIWGLADDALMPGNLTGLEALVPNCKIKTYPDADHWLAVVRSQEVNADIFNFLTSGEVLHARIREEVK